MKKRRSFISIAIMSLVAMFGITLMNNGDVVKDLNDTIVAKDMSVGSYSAVTNQLSNGFVANAEQTYAVATINISGRYMYYSGNNNIIEYRTSNDSTWKRVPSYSSDGQLYSQVAITMRAWDTGWSNSGYEFIFHRWYDDDGSYGDLQAPRYNGGLDDHWPWGTVWIELRYKLNPVEEVITTPSIPEDSDRPITDGTVLNFTTNYDNQMSVENIVRSFILIDGHDGDISIQINVDERSTYTASNRVGTYTLVLTGEDTSGNRAMVTINVTVIDNVKPWISGSKEIMFNVSQGINNQVIINTLDIKDNHDNKEALTITINNNTWNVGRNTAIINIRDTSGNQQEETIVVNVIDDVAPRLLNRPRETIRTSYNAGLAESYVISLFTFIDEHSDITVEVQRNVLGYFFNKNKVGTYTEIIKATDEYGNFITASLIIEVYDLVPPMFFIDDEVFVLTGNTLTIAQLVNNIRTMGFINELNDIQLISDTYSTSENGNGVIVFRLVKQDIELRYNVSTLSEVAEADRVDNNLSNASIGEEIAETFKNIFEEIKQHFQEHSMKYIIAVCVLVGLIGVGIIAKKRKNN